MASAPAPTIRSTRKAKTIRAVQPISFTVSIAPARRICRAFVAELEAGAQVPLGSRGKGRVSEGQDEPLETHGCACWDDGRGQKLGRPQAGGEARLRLPRRRRGDRNRGR